jgi:hypothetical protein
MPISRTPSLTKAWNSSLALYLDWTTVPISLPKHFKYAKITHFLERTTSSENTKKFAVLSYLELRQVWDIRQVSSKYNQRASQHRPHKKLKCDCCNVPPHDAAYGAVTQMSRPTGETRISAALGSVGLSPDRSTGVSCHFFNVTRFGVWNEGQL